MKMKVCCFCQKEYFPHGEYKSAQRKFCSSECYKKSINTSVDLCCKNCEKIFRVRGKYKHRKFCSTKCYYQNKRLNGQTVTEPCAMCGKDVQKYKYQQGKTKFCSRECMHNFSHKISVDNHNIFENVNTPEKAYALGLIASDGSVSPYGNRINLTMCDIDAINFFSNLIGYNNKISIMKGNLKHQDAYSVNFSSPKMFNDLVALNILPRKSFIDNLEPPNINEEFQYAFWAGFIDGDGSVGIKRNKCGEYVRITVVAKSKLYLEKLAQFLSINGISSCLRKDRNIYSISFGGKQTAEKIYNLFYRDEFGMERKRWKLKNYVKNIQNTMIECISKK